MLEIAGHSLAGFLDGLGEGEPVGKPRQAVAQHLGAQGPLGLDLDRPVDDAQQAARQIIVLARKRCELEPEIVRRNAFAVLEIELTGDLGAVKELLQQIGDRSRLQAFGVVPVERLARGLLDRRKEAAVVSHDLKQAAVMALDDRCGNRKRVEQAGIVRSRNVRFRARIVRPPAPLGARQPVSCSLHASGYAAEGLIRSIFLPLHRIVNRGLFNRLLARGS